MSPITPVVNQPIKFLGATVLSFNTTIGYGASQESTLSVELIEDCEAGDSFTLKDGIISVGAPVYFIAGIFEFGGVITNWTSKQGASGKTYSVSITDPRQLLENTTVIVDTFLGTPLQTNNYFNVYAGYETNVNNGDCSVFGTSLSSERGMPYQKVINKLSTMNPIIYSPTGYEFGINFNSFPTNLPEYYRVNGPAVSLLQMLQDVCDVLGYDFFVYLNSNNVIQIGLVDLHAPPSSFSYIINQYNGYATNLSYGQELRNEKTRSLMFGEKQHYLSVVTKFNHYFGEDLYGTEYVPVIPFVYNDYGFWISKKIDSVNSTLKFPLPSNGPFTISEADIKAAMSSRAEFEDRVFNPDIPGTFNAAVRQAFNNFLNNNGDASWASYLAGTNVPPEDRYRAYCDFSGNPSRPAAERNKPTYVEDIDKLHDFIANLGQTYYGKQFVAQLNQRICYYAGENFQERIYSDTPTTAGGWVDYGIPVLGLSDPELSSFREDDGRIRCFAYFDTSGTKPDPNDPQANNPGLEESDVEGVAQAMSSFNNNPST